MAKLNEYCNVSASDIWRVQKNVYEARSGVRPPLLKNVAKLHTLLNLTIVRRPTKMRISCLSMIRKRISSFFQLRPIFSFWAHGHGEYADGTFKSVPKLFYQLLTIHGFRNNNYVPLVFCLLLDKSILVYECVLRHLVCQMIDLGLECEPAEIFLDYENAVMSAVTKVWREVYIRGCRFHLAQSWWRQIQKQSLTESLYRCE